MIRGFDTDAHEELLRRIDGRQKRLNQIIAIIHLYAIHADEAGAWQTSMTALQRLLALERGPTRDILQRLQDLGVVEHQVSRTLTNGDVKSGLVKSDGMVHIRFSDYETLFPKGRARK